MDNSITRSGHGSFGHCEITKFKLFNNNNRVGCEWNNQNIS